MSEVSLWSSWDSLVSPPLHHHHHRHHPLPPSLSLSLSHLSIPVPAPLLPEKMRILLCQECRIRGRRNIWRPSWFRSEINALFSLSKRIFPLNKRAFLRGRHRAAEHVDLKYKVIPLYLFFSSALLRSSRGLSETQVYEP